MLGSAAEAALGGGHADECAPSAITPEVAAWLSAQARVPLQTPHRVCDSEAHRAPAPCVLRVWCGSAVKERAELGPELRGTRAVCEQLGDLDGG